MLPTSFSILDADHLERQTFGDAQLAGDLLLLFDGQCERLVPVIAASSQIRERADAAHALTGAARAVGASRVAALASEIEAGLDGGRPLAEVGALSLALEAASREVRAIVRSRRAEGPFRLAKPNGLA